MKKILIYAGLLTFGVTLSCNEKDLNKINPNGVTFDTYFNNAAELTAGVNGVYALTQGTNLGAREWFFTHDLRGDEMATGGGQLEAPRNQLLVGVNDQANTVSNAVWQGWYRVIHRANVVIEKGATLTNIDAALRDRLIAEAKFLRAWAYYELGTLWGGVPVYTSFVKSTSGSVARSSQSDVYKVAIDDLTAAQGVLPVSYTGNNIGRATKGAAQTLLARVYLQQGNYAAAKTELEKVVNSGTYALVDNYLDLTNEEGEFNKESIYEIIYAPSGGAFNWGGDADGLNVQEETIRSQEYGPTAWRNLIPSNKLLNAYEHTTKGDAKSDPRFEMSFWKNGDAIANGTGVLTDERVQGNTSIVNGVERKISWRKYSILYKADIPNQQSGINMRVMRYADVLLMLAECENEAGNSARAIQLVNQVRARASVNMPPLPTANIPTGTQAQIRSAIQHERYVELAGEQTRNADILRWRKNGKLSSEPISYFIQNKHELLPLPQNEVDNNPNVGSANQNPGY